MARSQVVIASGSIPTADSTELPRCAALFAGFSALGAGGIDQVLYDVVPTRRPLWLRFDMNSVARSNQIYVGWAAFSVNAERAELFFHLSQPELRVAVLLKDLLDLLEQVP